MKICFLSSTHPPFDKRVFDKEAVSLARAGFEVMHLAPGDGQTIHREGVTVVTYAHKPGLKGRLLQLWSLYKRADQVNADCYHCNEVDSWVVGVLLKLTRRKRIVFDVHEHYPSTFAESRFPWWSQPLVEQVVRLVFGLLIPFTDQIVLAKQSVDMDFKSGQHKLLLVRNFASLKYDHDNKLQNYEQLNMSQEGDTVTAIHLGLFSKIRGWPQLLDALAKTTHPNLSVHIIGTFNDNSRDDFLARANELNLTNRIHIDDWLPFEQAYQKLLSADLGLVLFQSGIQNHVYAFPHKMFDYMMARLPLIVPSFAQEIAPIVVEADCGILVDTSNPSEIAAALDYLTSNEKERKRLGENGRRAVFERYNWETEVQKLIAMYSQMEREIL